MLQFLLFNIKLGCTNVFSYLNGPFNSMVRYSSTTVLRNDVTPTNFIAKFTVNPEEGVFFYGKVLDTFGSKYSCIFMWQNNINNRCYIGYSPYLPHTVRSRYSKKSVLLHDALNGNSIIASYILLHGLDNFTLYVLADCSNLTHTQVTHLLGTLGNTYRPTLNVRPLGSKENMYYPPYMREDLYIKSPQNKALMSQASPYRFEANRKIHNYEAAVRTGQTHLLSIHDWDTGEWIMDWVGQNSLGRAWGYQNKATFKEKVDKGWKVRGIIDGKPRFVKVVRNQKPKP